MHFKNNEDFYWSSALVHDDGLIIIKNIIISREKKTTF